MLPELQNDAPLRNVLSESQEMNADADGATQIVSGLAFCSLFFLPLPQEEPEVLEQVELSTSIWELVKTGGGCCLFPSFFLHVGKLLPWCHNEQNPTGM